MSERNTKRVEENALRMLEIASQATTRASRADIEIASLKADLAAACRERDEAWAAARWAGSLQSAAGAERDAAWGERDRLRKELLTAIQETETAKNAAIHARAERDAARAERDRLREALREIRATAREYDGVASTAARYNRCLRVVDAALGAAGERSEDA